MALGSEPRYSRAVSDLDPHNARAVLGGLARRLDRALSAQDPEWRCRRILPRPDGSAALSLRLGAREELLLWVPPEAGGVVTGAAWGALEGPRLRDGAWAVVARILAKAVAHPAFALLAFVNRDLQVMRYGDAVVDTLLAGRCAPGHTRWFDWTFAEVFQGAADRFVLHFDGPPGRMTLAVTAPGVALEGVSLVAQAPQYRLWLVADPRPEASRQAVTQQVERFVAFLLARAVHPGLAVEGETVVTHDGGGLTGVALADPYGQGAPVSTARWGNPRQWHQFFSDFEVARAGLCGLVFTEPQAFITHGEPECHRVEPSVWPRPQVFARVPFATRSLAPEPGSREFAVVVGDRELVFGATEPLARALDAAEAYPEARFVMLNTTCLPKMAGDDVASLLSARRAPGSKPIIAINTDLDSPEATYHDLVRQMARPSEETPFGEAREGIGLLGFTPGRARDELMTLCQAIGLPVSGCLGPELSPKRVAAFRRAVIQVVYPSPPWPALQQELFGDLGVVALSPFAPYGLAGSEEWFAALAEATGELGAKVRERYLEAVEPYARRFNALRTEVEGVGMALVVDAQEIDRLIAPERCYGVRLLNLLGECGFAVHLLLREPPERADEALDEGVLTRLEAERFPGQALQVHRFCTEGELHDLLDGVGLQLAYSEVACDDRLARHGLVGVGLDVWELGPMGAVRSLERLRRLARWPFFARYARRNLPPPVGDPERSP